MSPIKRRFAFVVLMPLVALGLASCGGDEGEDGGTKTFSEDAFPFTFEYPDDWAVSDDITVSQTVGSGADETLAVLLDDNNLINVQSYTLNIEVTDENLADVKAEYDGVIQQLSAEAGESVETEVAGLPALEVESAPIESEEDLESRFISFFDGDQQYLINCQSTPEERETVESVCDEAIASLELTD